MVKICEQIFDLATNHVFNAKQLQNRLFVLNLKQEWQAAASMTATCECEERCNQLLVETRLLELS